MKQKDLKKRRLYAIGNSINTNKLVVNDQNKERVAELLTNDNLLTIFNDKEFMSVISNTQSLFL
jgi:hypothetical protein